MHLATHDILCHKSQCFCGLIRNYPQDMVVLILNAATESGGYHGDNHHYLLCIDLKDSLFYLKFIANSYRIWYIHYTKRCFCKRIIV